MSQHYSDQTREDDEHALPDLEVFYLTAEEVVAQDDDLVHEAEEGITGGWFYWYCFPGCLPDGEPIGPFESQAAALADARSQEAEQEGLYDDGQ